MVTIVKGITNKPTASQILCDFFKENSQYDGWLYIGYPIITTSDGTYPVDALWISKMHGLVIFDLIENQRTIINYEELQDDHYNKVQSKLYGYKQLVNRRKLSVEINIVTFSPRIQNNQVNEEYPLCDKKSLGTVLNDFVWNEGNQYYEKLLSAIQSISSIRKGNKRVIQNEGSRGYKLKCLEDSIANLDRNQSRAVIETVEGIQRIRGLAGSGKTIVLALKAAYLHAQNPDWKIAVTFNTRSLKGQYRKLITDFYIEQKQKEPDWTHLQIIHAWGAPGNELQNGIYYMFCQKNGVSYFNYNEARYSANQQGDNKDPFSFVCQKALQDASQQLPVDGAYDAILVDEAQDFSPEFLQICYKLLKSPKRLVYAYDELQNLGRESLPSLEKIFGENSEGVHPQMEADDDGFSRQDIILQKCYRNSRLTLVTAHALGFGIYRTPLYHNESTGIIQMFDNSHIWQDIGYEVQEGELSDGKRVRLGRNSKTSPIFLENHSPDDDIVMFKAFQNRDEQDEWVHSQIKRNLTTDELQAADIMVINPNPVTTRNNVGHLRAILFDDNIQSHIAGVDSAPDVFFSEKGKSIVFSGIYRAKGNEAGMVYIVNAEECFASSDLARIRNILFTAITRSKAWVRVLGVGERMNQLMEEYQKVKDNKYTLNFVYPTREQRRHMNIVNRDKSNDEKKALKESKNAINDLIRKLQDKTLYKEDLDPNTLEKLKQLLQ